jgi:hypothetical protein
LLALLVQKYKILTRELEFLQFARDVFVREHAARQRAAAGKKKHKKKTLFVSTLRGSVPLQVLILLALLVQKDKY